jgi:hypothetical protein
MEEDFRRAMLIGESNVAFANLGVSLSSKRFRPMDPRTTTRLCHQVCNGVPCFVCKGNSEPKPRTDSRIRCPEVRLWKGLLQGGFQPIPGDARSGHWRIEEDFPFLITAKCQ